MRKFIEHITKGLPVRLVWGAAGAGLGLAYYSFIGCDGGCPITGNPWTSTAYGAFLGLLAYPGPKSQPNDPAPGSSAELSPESPEGGAQ